MLLASREVNEGSQRGESRSSTPARSEGSASSLPRASRGLVPLLSPPTPASTCPGPVGSFSCNLPESFDPAKNSLSLSSTDHGSRVTACPPVAIPLRSNRNAFISFLFTPLRTLSFTTRGVSPSLNFISHSFAQDALHERRNCALLRNNSFASQTCASHGGRGGYESI